MRIEVPAKIFLAGEYAVLEGAPALVAAVGPRFEARVGHQLSLQPHRDSPAGRWLGARALEFQDPFEGRGGFGASSAQFAAAFFAYPDVSVPSWQSAWLNYRALFKDQSVLPSGADLATQWAGGVQRFSLTSDGRAELLSLGHHLDLSGISVFSAAHQSGRKVKTHEHLAQADQRPWAKGTSLFDELKEILARSIAALEKEDFKTFAPILTEYAQALSAHGLELEAARSDREAFLKIPGVLGAKGSGALLADAFLVARDVENPQAWEQIQTVARERDLKLVCPALVLERGITWILDA